MLLTASKKGSLLAMSVHRTRKHRQLITIDIASEVTDFRVRENFLQYGTLLYLRCRVKILAVSITAVLTLSGDVLNR